MKNNVNVSKNIEEKKIYFVGILNGSDEKSRIRIHKSVVRISGPDSYQNVTDHQHCLDRIRVWIQIFERLARSGHTWHSWIPGNNIFGFGSSQSKKQIKE
jgi:hypothetical protein